MNHLSPVNEPLLFGGVLVNEEKITTEVLELARYRELSEKGLFFWAHTHSDDEEAMRIASFYWRCNARHMAKAVEWFPDEFEEEPEYDTLLALYTLAQLGRDKAMEIYEQMKANTWGAFQIRTLVDEKKKRIRVPKKRVVIDPAKVACQDGNVMILAPSPDVLFALAEMDESSKKTVKIEAIQVSEVSAHE